MSDRISRNFAGLIQDLQVEARGLRQRTGAHLHELVRGRIDAPDEVLEWAKRDRRWSFTLAELMKEPVSRPRELAARLVTAIVDELEQEREIHDADAADAAVVGEQPLTALHAD